LLAENFRRGELSTEYAVFSLRAGAFSSLWPPKLKDSSRSAQPFFSILKMDATTREFPDGRRRFFDRLERKFERGAAANSNHQEKKDETE
jgi:hypothetical protein